MNKDTQDFLVNKIRSDYEVKKNRDLEDLLALDRKIKLAPTICVFTIGIIGALILGFGMSLVMTNFMHIENNTFLGIIIGIIGLIIVSVNYPLYRYYLAARKEKYKNEVIRLADKLSD